MPPRCVIEGQPKIDQQVRKKACSATWNTQAIVDLYLEQHYTVYLTDWIKKDQLTQLFNKPVILRVAVMVLCGS